MNKKKTELDFPFYNDPTIRTIDILILLAAPILFSIYTFTPFSIPFGMGPYVFTLVHLVAFLYVARGKISLLIKNPRIRDYIRIIVTLILQYIFAIGISMVLKNVLNVTLNNNEVLELNMGIKFWIAVIVQLFGEELYKILIFLAVLTIMNKKTKKRTLSIVVATTVSLLCFALLHATTYNSIIQIIVLQGFVSIFCLYNYLKTKNILTSYFEHLLFDAIPFILVMIDIIPK